MPSQLSYQELEIMIRTLDAADPCCMSQIASTRALLEDAYSSGALTLNQWRALWEDVSLVQARCAMIQPDAWRFPTIDGCHFTYVPPPPEVLNR